MRWLIRYYTMEIIENTKHLKSLDGGHNALGLCPGEGHNFSQFWLRFNSILERKKNIPRFSLGVPTGVAWWKRDPLRFRSWVRSPYCLHHSKDDRGKVDSTANHLLFQDKWTSLVSHSGVTGSEVLSWCFGIGNTVPTSAGHHASSHFARERTLKKVKIVTKISLWVMC